MVPVTGTPLRTHRLRPVNVPRRVFVELNQRGLPVAVSSSSSPVWERGSGGEEHLSVSSIGEVWRVYDEWWRNPIMRRYFEIVLVGGKHTIIYQDEVSGEWFEQTP